MDAAEGNGYRRIRHGEALDQYGTDGEDDKKKNEEDCNGGNEKQTGTVNKVAQVVHLPLNDRAAQGSFHFLQPEMGENIGPVCRPGERESRSPDLVPHPPDYVC
jgi:hypothetical protein